MKFSKSCWDVRSIGLPLFGIKTSNKMEYIDSDIKNIKAPRTDDPLICMRKHTYMVHLKELLKLFKCPTSNGIHTITKWLDLLFNALYQERK